MRKKGIIPLLTTVFLLFCNSANALTPAFPGAEGAGKYATGGRGGAVYEVTNLDDSGPGSLRAGVGDLLPKIIVFRVSGTIELASALSFGGNKTVAGQTAPGDGITLKGRTVTVGGDNTIIRYIRVRPGEVLAPVGKGDIDAFNPVSSNIIIDHVSTSWGTDEVLSFGTATTIQNITVQWCIISEGLNYSVHTEGAHSKGTLLYGAFGHKFSFHHNIYAHNIDRNPRLAGNYRVTEAPYYDTLGLYCDFRNNVVYNWGLNYAGHSGSDINYAKSINFVGNYYIHGPNSPETSVPWEEKSLYSKGYFNDNWVDGNNPADPWSVVRFVGLTDANIAAYKQSSELPITPIPPTDGALTAYQKVLAGAGCTVPYRDSVDSRIVNDVANVTGGIIDCTEANDFYYGTATATGGTINTITFPSTYYSRETGQDGYDIKITGYNGDPNGTGAGQVRLITYFNPSTMTATVTPNWDVIPDSNSQYAMIIHCGNNAGGWPVLTSTTPPVDTDHDGMPDAWENAKGLDPNDINDGKIIQPSGYSNVELYLNYLVDKKTALPADFDEDGDVDENDLNLFTEGWLENDCYDVPRGNMDFDCDADFKDYAVLADYWLEVYGY